MIEKITGTSDLPLQMWRAREVPKAREYKEREDRGSKIMERTEARRGEKMKFELYVYHPEVFEVYK